MVEVAKVVNHDTYIFEEDLYARAVELSGGFDLVACDLGVFADCLCCLHRLTGRDRGSRRPLLWLVRCDGPLFHGHL